MDTNENRDTVIEVYESEDWGEMDLEAKIQWLKMLDVAVAGYIMSYKPIARENAFCPSEFQVLDQLMANFENEDTPLNAIELSKKIKEMIFHIRFGDHIEKA